MAKKVSKTKKKLTKSKSTSKKLTKVKKSKSTNTPAMRCAKHYAIALVDPFDQMSVGACIPRLPARPSVKQQGRFLGSVQSGSNTGKFFVAIMPSVANEMRTLCQSTNTWNGVRVDTTNGEVFAGRALNIVQGDLKPKANLNVPDDYDVPKYRCRIVSCGFRIRCTSRNDALNGTLYAFASPSHASCEGLSPADFGLSEHCKRVPISKEWTQLTFSAIDEEELMYGATKPFIYGNESMTRLLYYPYCQGIGVGTDPLDDMHGAPIGVVWGECETGQPLTFEYEYIIHYEWYEVNEKQSLETENPIFPHTDTLAAHMAKARQVSQDADGGNDGTILREYAKELSESPITELREIGEWLMNNSRHGSGVSGSRLMKKFEKVFSNHERYGSAYRLIVENN